MLGRTRRKQTDRQVFLQAVEAAKAELAHQKHPDLALAGTTDSTHPVTITDTLPEPTVRSRPQSKAQI